jgi:16S rRNA (guanine(1405)-N(7))-methyltransferase
VGSVTIAVDDVVARVRTSRRYRWVAEDVVRRLAADEISRSRNVADAEKRTKRRLHQIFGAYTGQADYSRLLLSIAEAQPNGPEALRAACRAAMTQHASTRERLAILDEFYPRVFAVTGVPRTVVDVACGLNPLGLPWMGLGPDTRYVSCDIDTGLLGLVSGFLDLMGVEHRAELRDIVTSPPDDVCDVMLILKTVPCLDQQDPEAAARILRAAGARHVVISFPTQSLGGRGKGMALTYRARFEELMTTLDRPVTAVTDIDFPGELVYVVTFGASS